MESKVFCDDCGKELKEVTTVSFAQLRRVKQQLMERHKQNGECNKW